MRLAAIKFANKTYISSYFFLIMQRKKLMLQIFISSMSFFLF